MNNSGFYPTTPDYDEATGLGTPKNDDDHLERKPLKQAATIVLRFAVTR